MTVGEKEMEESSGILARFWLPDVPSCRRQRQGLGLDIDLPWVCQNDEIFIN